MVQYSGSDNRSGTPSSSTRLFRLLPLLSLIALILDQTISPKDHELRHGLVGFATGLLFVLSFVALNIKSVTLKKKRPLPPLPQLPSELRLSIR
jgi:hypothetical protein